MANKNTQNRNNTHRKFKVVEMNNKFYKEVDDNLFILKNGKKCRVFLTKNKEGEEFVNEILDEKCSVIQIRTKDGGWRTIQPEDMRSVPGVKVKIKNDEKVYANTDGTKANGVSYTNKDGNRVAAKL